MIAALTYLSSGAVSWAAAPSPAELAARVDRHLAVAWQAAGVEPAGLTADDEYLRRIYLDLIGRIPTVAETRAFLDDSRPDKRAHVARSLLETSAHARQLAMFWRRVWIPQADTPQFANLTEGFEAWLAGQILDRAPYDGIVRDMLSVPLVGTRDAAAPAGRTSTPVSFLAASEFKPELLAANTTRAFLGINLDCAQCHDHPFARWTRQQFWQTAAFFARPTPAEDNMPVRLEVTIPETEIKVGPQLLDGKTIEWPAELESDTGRHRLAEWVSAADNPYLARNAVNRLWAYFFGTGLVEPLDDMSGDNPPSHPELLAELSEAFVASDMSQAYLIEALLLSNAYQRSSRPASGSAELDDPQLFASATVRGLMGEQLYDSLRIAAGLPAERIDLDPEGALAMRNRFAAQFHLERPSQAQRSIMQALTMLNGQFLTELTTPDTCPTLAATAEAPFLDTHGKVRTLFLAVLGRDPSQEELGPLVSHVERAGAAGDSQAALADVFWALLNTSEFNTNH